MPLAAERPRAAGVSAQFLFLAMLSLACRANAQRVGIGVVGGIALTDAFPEQTYAASGSFFARFGTYSPFKDYVLGARVQVRITQRWSVLADGLYREMQATTAAVLSDGTLSSVSPAPVVTWEIPVLARYRFGGKRVQPFLEAGPSFRAIGNRNSNPSGYGVAAGIGVQLRAGWLNIAPQLRYTRWAADPEQPSRTGPNQAEILVGLTTPSETAIGEAFRGRLSIGGIVGTNLANDYRAGAPFTTEYPGVAITSQFHSGPRSVMGGPVVEVHAGPVSFAASFLRRVLHGTVDDRFSNGISRSSQSTTGVWEIPVLVKYRIGGPFRTAAWRPLVEAGPAFRQGPYLPHYGGTAGAGVERRVGPLKIAPGLRYTRWQGSIGLVPNEIAMLVGVRY